MRAEESRAVLRCWAQQPGETITLFGAFLGCVVGFPECLAAGGTEAVEDWGRAQWPVRS